MNYYGIIISFSIFISTLIAERLTPKKGRNVLWGLVFWVVISGIFGARIYHVLHYFSFYLKEPVRIFSVYNGGLGIWGALFGGTVAGIVYLKVKGQKILPWLNLTGLVLPLGQAIGRLGNFFNQEIFGPPTYLPWGIYIKPENRPIEYLKYQKFHPLFLYETLLNLFLFFVLYRLWNKGKRKNIFWIYLAGYSIIRFFLEYLRIEPWALFGLNVSQCVSILVLVASFVFIKVTNR